LTSSGLAALAAQTGLEITVCHFPPGTSRWNKIEHRLFSQITMNWRGRPLTSHQVILNTIAATTTTAGLTVTAALDTGRYPTGTQITGAQMKDLEARALTRHDFHGTWNYTLHPAAPARPDPPPAPAPPGRPALLAALAHPALTGMPRHDLDALAAALPAPARPARLSPADQVLATCLHDRLAVPLHVLAYLAGVHPSTISPAITATRRDLAAQGITITPGPARLTTLARLSDYAAAAGITLPEPGTAATTPGPDTPGTLN
jgi:hypothetical protein